MDEQHAIRQLRRFGAAKAELEQARERGRAYVEQVRQEVEQGLVSYERELLEARASLEAFLHQENGGKKFSVPGLGTAFLRTTKQVNLTDLDAFLEAYERDFGSTDAFYERKLSKSKVKTAAEGALQEHGQLLDGVEVREVTAVSVRLANPGSASEPGSSGG